MRSFVLFLGIAACTPRAFTPPARPLPLSSARTPAPGEGDFQLDGNASGEPLGPGIYAGNVRYRHGITEELAITGDIGFARADNAGDTDYNPWAGLGRVGVQVAHKSEGDLDAAAFAGVGGGHAPAAGSWVSSDVGGMLTGTNRYVRPIFLVDAFVSQPFATKVFEVDDEMLRLPRTAGLQGLLGFEIGPQKSAVVLGFALAQLWAAANDVQDAESSMFIGLGGGMRFDSMQ